MRHTASGTHAHAHSAPTLSPNFTPGPWLAIGHRRILGNTPASLPICEVWSGGVGIDQADANERLIAAAPDLYQALRSALVVVAGCNGDGLFNAEEHAIRAALGKVAGNSAASGASAEPAQEPATGADFPAVFTEEQVHEAEADYERRWGMRRRFMMIALSRSGAELRACFTPVQAHDALVNMADEIVAFREHLESGLRLADTALERLKAVAVAIDEGGAQ